MGHEITIGVLALQGGFAKHIEKLHSLGVRAIEVRYPQQLPSCDGLILPGGESTTIGKLLEQWALLEPIWQFDKPLFGTCAGMILLSKMGKIAIDVERNAYGRQADSFTAHFSFQDKPCSGVFIRAPKISAICAPDVKILAQYNGEAVCVEQNNVLAASFHPELTSETAIHEYFTKNVYERKNCCLKCC